MWAIKFAINNHFRNHLWQSGEKVFRFLRSRKKEKQPNLVCNYRNCSKEEGCKQVKAKNDQWDSDNFLGGRRIVIAIVDNKSKKAFRLYFIADHYTPVH